jgi:hypothetical protein
MGRLAVVSRWEIQRAEVAGALGRTRSATVEFENRTTGTPHGTEVAR